MNVRKMKPLPLFLMIMGAYVPTLLTFLIGDPLYHYFREIGHEEFYNALGLVAFFLTASGIPLYWNWRISLPHRLAETIPPNLRPDLSRLIVIYWLPLIVFMTIMMFYMIAEVVSVIGFGSDVFYALNAIAWSCFLIGWGVSYVYTSIITAYLLRTAELGRKPDWHEILNAFWLVMLGVFGAPFLANRYRALEDWTGDLV